MPHTTLCRSPATSRTRPRISTESPPKAAEAPIIRTCKSARFVLIAAAVAAAVPAHASGDSGEVLNALVRARLAEAGGEPVVALTALATVSRAAQLGRASWRDRVCKSWDNPVVAVSLKKKKDQQT